MRTAFPITANAWARLRKSIVGLRRDRGRALILKGIDKIMNNDPSAADRQHARAILRALVEMNEAEIRRTDP